MLQITELLVWAWVLPLILVVAIPLLTSSGKCFVSLFRNYCSPVEKEEMIEEKRKHRRYSLKEGNCVEVRMGDNACSIICTGLLSDISRVGISLTEIPVMFLDRVERLTVVIRGYGEDHTLRIKPKWSVATVAGKQIGAEIESASAGWQQFLKTIESKA